MRPKHVILAVLAIAAATVIGLLRVTGTGALQSIWEEDSRNILTDAYYRTGAETLVLPINGYYIVVARAIGVLASLMPVSWAAAVLSISAAIILGLMVLLVYVISGAHFSSTLARVMVTVPLLIAPVAENNRAEIYNRPVCFHLFALYVLFWIILWVPTKRLPKLVAVTFAGLAAFSTLLTIVFLPLALVRVIVRRDRTGVGILAVLAAGGLANALNIGAGNGGGRSVMYPQPLVALWDYVIWGLPSSMLGYRATADLGGFHFPTVTNADVPGILATNIWLILAAWAVVVAIVAVAATRRFTRPAWLLAVAAAAHSVGLLCFMVMAQGNETRYLLPVELLLFAALTVLLLPGDGQFWMRNRAPLAAFAVFILFISAFNFRWHDTYRSIAPRWSDQVREAYFQCTARPELQEVVVRAAPRPFGSIVHVPCHRLRFDRPWDCPDPRCDLVNGNAPEAVVVKRGRPAD